MARLTYWEARNTMGPLYKLAVGVAFYGVEAHMIDAARPPLSYDGFWTAIENSKRRMKNY